MESQIPRPPELYTANIRHALAQGDAAAVLALIEHTEPTEGLEAVGLRLQLKDYWVDRKTGLAHALHRAEKEGPETPIRDFLVDGDRKLSSLKGEPYHAEPEEPDATTETRMARFISEVRQKSGADRLAFVQRFGSLTAEQLMAPEDLLTWATDWRNTSVERLWSVVGEYRDRGRYDTVVQRTFTEQANVLNNDYNHLITGSVYLEQ